MATFAKSVYPLVALGRVASIRLGKMLQPEPIRGDDDLAPYLRAGSLSNLSAEELPEMYASVADRSTYGVRAGDLLVAEGGDAGRTEFAPIVSPGTIIQNSLHRVRSSTMDQRFLKYCLEAIYRSSWLDVVCNKSTFGHLTLEKIRSLAVPVPPFPDQVRIANFLDRQLQQIDGLIELKVRQVEKLTERSDASFRYACGTVGVDLPPDLSFWNEAVLPPSWRLARLGPLLLQLTNGYVGPTRDILVDDGLRYIQGLHIKGGRIDFDRRPFYVTREWHEARTRIALRPGDVLIVQTGDIGQCAVVPEDFGEASCHALLIARPNDRLISPRFLGCYLQSEVGRAQLLRLATGALHPHLEFGIRGASVPLPPLDDQEHICEVVDSWKNRARTHEALVTRQLALLDERRRALITAAVTGELDLALEIAGEAS